MRTVLFVCTGNTCRSPMAEAIARHLLEEDRESPNGGERPSRPRGRDGAPIRDRGRMGTPSTDPDSGISEPESEDSSDGRRPDVFVASAGVGAIEGVLPSPETVNTLRRMGIPYEGRAKALSAEMIRNADLVLCMTEEHAEIARKMVEHEPDHLAKISTLDPQGDIEDPVGMGQVAYDDLATRLLELIPQRLEGLLQR